MYCKFKRMLDNCFRKIHIILLILCRIPTFKNIIFYKYFDYSLKYKYIWKQINDIALMRFVYVACGIDRENKKFDDDIINITEWCVCVRVYGM